MRKIVWFSALLLWLLPFQVSAQTGEYSFSLRFMVSDGVNNLELTVGIDDNGVTGEYIEGLDQLAPPPPPAGSFDARLISSGNSYFKKYFENNADDKSIVFEYSASIEGTTPIQITWDDDLAG